MYEIPRMILVEKADLRLSTQQILNEGHKNIKPLSSLLCLKKIESFGTVELDSFQAWFAVSV